MMQTLARSAFLTTVPAFEEAAREALAGGRVALVGLPPAARALALLALARLTGAPLGGVARSDADAEALAGDLRALAQLTGVLDPGSIQVFPALDADPYAGLSPHLGAVCERVRCLDRLRSGRARVTVAPARALLVALPPGRALEAHFVTLREGERFLHADDPAWFLRAGYRRADLVSDPGEFSRRGGILDVFPPIAERPLRIELEGDTIVSMRRFDPLDQRSTGRVESADLSPARETILGPEALASLEAAVRRSASSPTAVARLTEALGAQGDLAGVEACARVLYPEAGSLLDALSQRGSGAALVFCDEPEMCLEEIAQHRAEVMRSFEGAVPERRALPPPERLLLPPDRVEEALERATAHLRHLDLEEAAATVSTRDESGPAGASGGRVRLRFQGTAVPSYRGRLADLMEEVRDEAARGRSVFFLMKSLGRARRMEELLLDAGLPPATLDAAAGAAGAGRGIHVGAADLSGGFALPEAELTVVTEREIFGEEVRHRKRSALPAFTSDFRDLAPGDLVVHVDHGVARYEGLSRVGTDGREVDVMVLSYQGTDRLFVPVTRLDLVQKYSGAGGQSPRLDKLGGATWARTKQRVKKEMQEMAAELLNLYAARKAVSSHAFGPDADWQQEFEASFPYELTPDQQAAVLEIKKDLESGAPMDRLLCGDVGFGKTEVALRAAFKVVMEGKQVALLAPTTVLVLQHLNTFRERFAAFPTRIESLSRFRSPKELKATAAALSAGVVDVAIGTHRLLSDDVAFKDLGLLIVDEEQRFGVAHKEKLKRLKRSVHVLTLTATPIPRTLQMSLMGVRDLSVIETPPENRLSIQTHLITFQEPVIAAAVRHELDRGGQVYFVHNRVESVYAMAALLKRLVPDAAIGVAHGQMKERDLEDTMIRFLQGSFHVLVSTTIIENGLDIPRVNTLVVNRADRFGLAQLYQMRGRIGRSDRQAYAYMLVPPGRTLTEPARKRLKALQDFSELGSGFRVAAMDLEIRGAGSLLGAAQHGHIAALGFELYCRMLERAVAELKSGQPELPELRASINLAVDLKIPTSYIAGEHHRLMFYKRLASAASREELERIREEMEDRYGRLPPQGLTLLEVAGLRLLAEQLQVQQVDYRAGALTVKFAEASPVEPERVLRLVRRRADATFSPPAVLRVKGERGEADRLALARELLTGLA